MSSELKQENTPKRKRARGAEATTTAGIRSSPRHQQQAQQKSIMIQARKRENQPLIDALVRLAQAEANAAAAFPKDSTRSRDNNKLQFKSAAFFKAARALADLDEVISSGQPLSQSGSPRKVPGVGRATGLYIDEFLKTKTIADIQKYEQMAAAAAQQNNKKKNASDKKEDDDDIVQINRAPVLTLWVTVVAMRQGHSREEALTYGKWISGVFARAKGKALGIFEDKDDDDDESTTSSPKAKRQRRQEREHVQVFQHVKIPVIVEKNGNRLALSQERAAAVNADSVQAYLDRSFGNKLEPTMQAMEILANSMSPEELRERAYHLYEIFRPTWKGWGAKGAMNLNQIRGLAK